MRRKPEVPEEEVPVGRMFRLTTQELPQRNLHQFHSVTKGHPPECFFYKTKSGCRIGEKCSYAHRQVDEQPSKRSENEWGQKCSSQAEEA